MASQRRIASKDSFRNFLFIVARNHILDELRRKTKEGHFTQHLQAWFRESPTTPDQYLLFQESQALLRKAIDTLPAQQRQVYLLTRENGWSQDEIAQYLQLSKSTIKTHMARALAAIRAYLANHAQGILLLVAFLECLL
ncbi:sigma-70 family RNA polymerase sigma factor [Paraflavitalea speifideaquila]|uniref:sigma-70 family RNA polymerase sigma factor n=1 Tax=Paraflavitalea speifideaquila TaxID=3076558 RepID=UPI0028E2A60A|nr:sigma-70 family RNA polymerase sigma factor [Paraflavitalea speifideiaquila]